MTKRQMRKTINKEIVKSEVNYHKTVRFCNGCYATVVGGMTAVVIKICIDLVTPKLSKKKDVDVTSENEK